VIEPIFMAAISLFPVDHEIARTYSHAIVMRGPMRNFLAIAGALPGFDLQWASPAQSQRAHAASRDSSLSLEEPSFSGFTKPRHGSEPRAVAKALGIAIGLTVLYVMLRHYGSPIV
jgi:hypothetical protein